MLQAAKKYIAAVRLWFIHHGESAVKAVSLNNTAAEPAEQLQAAVREASVAEDTGLNSEETSMDKRAVVLAEYEQILQQYVSGRVGCFFCSHPKCTYTSTKSVHVAEHVESRHIQGYTVSCLTCKEEFPTLASYGRHSCHVERSLRKYQVKPSATLQPAGRKKV